MRGTGNIDTRMTQIAEQQDAGLQFALMGDMNEEELNIALDRLGDKFNEILTGTRNDYPVFFAQSMEDNPDLAAACADQNILH